MNTKSQTLVVVPYYGVAITWAIYVLLFDLYKPIHFIGVGILSAAVFAFLWKVCGGNKVDKEKFPCSQANNEPTGNAELDQILADGKSSLQKMHHLRIQLHESEISLDLNCIEKNTDKILTHVRDNPRKLPKIRQFMDYYLPTTIKLVETYNEMTTVGISGKNIKSTKMRIASMIRIIAKAFEMQLDRLFNDEALDISTDIEVLERMLNSEGLISSSLKTNTSETADRITLKL